MNERACVFSTTSLPLTPPKIFPRILFVRFPNSSSRRRRRLVYIFEDFRITNGTYEPLLPAVAVIVAQKFRQTELYVFYTDFQYRILLSSAVYLCI